MDLVLKKNKGFNTLLKVCSIINRKYETEEKMLILLSIWDKYCYLNMLQQHHAMWIGVSAIINLFFGLITGRSH